MNPCPWLENGQRCGKARLTGEMPEEAINPERLVEEKGVENSLQPIGQLIADCRIALEAGNDCWPRIGKCDPRSN